MIAPLHLGQEQTSCPPRPGPATWVRRGGYLVPHPAACSLLTSGSDAQLLLEIHHHLDLRALAPLRARADGLVLDFRTDLQPDEDRAGLVEDALDTTREGIDVVVGVGARVAAGAGHVVIGELQGVGHGLAAGRGVAL